MLCIPSLAWTPSKCFSYCRVLLRPSWTSKILLQDVFLAHIWTGLNGNVASHVDMLSEGIVRHAAPRRCQMSQTLNRVNIVKVPTASTLFRNPKTCERLIRYNWPFLSTANAMFEAMTIFSFLAPQWELFTNKSSWSQLWDFHSAHAEALNCYNSTKCIYLRGETVHHWIECSPQIPNPFFW